MASEGRVRPETELASPASGGPHGGLEAPVGGMVQGARRRDALRILGAAGKGKRVMAFHEM